MPTPVVHTRLRAPLSSMEAVDVAAATQSSPPTAKYAKRLDRESAAEVLARRVEAAADADASKPAPGRRAPQPRPRTTKAPAKGPTDELTDFLSSRSGKALQREVVRGVFGLLRKKL